jgi:hypothetical protein
MGRAFVRCFRYVLLFAATLAALHAESFRLYLKDGTWQQVREYQKLDDRVRYYSVERSDWEELPLELIDFSKTEAERKQRVEQERKSAAATDEEEKFERGQEHLVSLIPQGPGAYYLEGETALALKQAEPKIVTDKRRAVLKALSPMPVVSGKATIEIDGVQSRFPLKDDRPAFWFRLANYERFGIVKCTPKKESRVVETWQIEQVTKEVYTDRKLVEIFRQQVGEGLYKIWPQEPLAPGEYAVVEFTEGARNTQVWDFRIEKK